MTLKHCPVTGKPPLACGCGACDDVDELDEYVTGAMRDPAFRAAYEAAGDDEDDGDE